jgi:hypothetical protein
VTTTTGIQIPLHTKGLNKVTQKKKDWRILNLGAGVQSTAIYMLMIDGEIEPADVAIFADTQEEPSDVYTHLDWLESQGGPRIIRATAGRIGDDLIQRKNSSEQRCASIPAFTSAYEGAAPGITRRQCTAEYKIDVVNQVIRRQLLGLVPRQRVPKDAKLTQLFGFSTDEPKRAGNTRIRFEQQMGAQWAVEFPLLDESLWMSRRDCRNYLDRRVAHHVPRSACVFCPFKSNREWKLLRDNDPVGWARAVEVDAGIREEGAPFKRNLDQLLYVHRSCVPLDQVKLDDGQLSLFDMECEGGCGL